MVAAGLEDDRISGLLMSAGMMGSAVGGGGVVVGAGLR